MKVLFSIFSHHGTPGGHGFSFEHTLYSLKDKLDILIIYVGHKDYQMESLPYKKYYFDNKLSSLLKARKIIKNEQPEVIHCFDDDSFYFMSLSSLGLSTKKVLTIAGGNPNPKRMPYCEDIILFSQETMNSFGKCIRYKNINLHYIPNRVVPALLTNKSFPSNSCYTFLQVIRLNVSKHPQITSTLEFLKIMRDKNINSRLILAGTINSESEKKFIETYVKENNLQDRFTLITDDRVNRGSDLLPYADCVIGTGRSVMESIILGKCVLVPVKKTKFPILLDETSFWSLFEYNFSGRTENSFSEDYEMEKIIRITRDNSYRSQNLAIMKKYGEKYFELTFDVVNKYLKIYQNARPISAFQTLKNNFEILVKYSINSYIASK